MKSHGEAAVSTSLSTASSSKARALLEQNCQVAPVDSADSQENMSSSRNLLSATMDIRERGEKSSQIGLCTLPRPSHAGDLMHSPAPLCKHQDASTPRRGSAVPSSASTANSPERLCGLQESAHPPRQCPTVNPTAGSAAHSAELFDAGTHGGAIHLDAALHMPQRSIFNDLTPHQSHPVERSAMENRVRGSCLLDRVLENGVGQIAKVTKQAEASEEKRVSEWSWAENQRSVTPVQEECRRADYGAHRKWLHSVRLGVELLSDSYWSGEEGEQTSNDVQQVQSSETHKATFNKGWPKATRHSKCWRKLCVE